MENNDFEIKSKVENCQTPIDVDTQKEPVDFEEWEKAQKEAFEAMYDCR